MVVVMVWRMDVSRSGGRYIKQHSERRRVGVVGDMFGRFGIEAGSSVAKDLRSRGCIL